MSGLQFEPKVTLKTILHFGPWLSLVERLVRVEEVAGSNPAGPTTLKTNSLRASWLQKQLMHRCKRSASNFEPSEKSATSIF